MGRQEALKPGRSDSNPSPAGAMIVGNFKTPRSRLLGATREVVVKHAGFSSLIHTDLIEVE